jgi:hypothetical protein
MSVTTPFEPSRGARMSPWSTPSSASYRVAAMRAAAISVVLLAGLVLLVLF